MKQLTTRWGRQPAATPLPEYTPPRHGAAGLAQPERAVVLRLHLSSSSPPCNTGAPSWCPYSPRPALSGVGRQLQPGEFFCGTGAASRSQRPKPAGCLLHFGAVDQTCRVWVNGLEAGGHTGGYLPFTLNITGPLRAAAGGRSTSWW